MSDVKFALREERPLRVHRRGPRPLEEGPAASTNSQLPNYDEIADVVAVLPKLRATAPDGVPNEAFQSAPLVMVTQLQKVCTGGRIPSARRGTRLVDVPKTKKAGGGGDQSKRRSVGLETVRRDGTANGEALQKLADGRHPTEVGGDRVALRGEGSASDGLRTPIVFVDAAAAFCSVLRDALWGRSRMPRGTRELF